MITKPMTYPIRIWSVILAGLLAFYFSSEAGADFCKYEKNFDLTLDLSGSELLVVAAGAGGLEITGVAGADEAVIHGRACVSKEAWLDEVSIETHAGKKAKITGQVSHSDSDFCIGICYRSLDLEIKVPAGIALEVNDSSGSMWLANVGAAAIKDSSGDIEVNGSGALRIADSSGDIELEDIKGDISLSDTSGGIYGAGIAGSVLVERDSSGNITFRDVSGDVIVERDSSGNIKVADVGGDFRVLKDGSGSIESSNVKGEVVTP